MFKGLISKLSNAITRISKRRAHRKQVVLLYYALTALNVKGKSEDAYYRESKKEMVEWLYKHYTTGNYPYDISPKEKMEKILNSSTKDFTVRHKIYLQVLYNWNNYKRIEGF